MSWESKSRARKAPPPALLCTTAATDSSLPAPGSKTDYVAMLFVVFLTGFLTEALMSVRAHITNKKSHLYDELDDVSQFSRNL